MHHHFLTNFRFFKENDILVNSHSGVSGELGGGSSSVAGHMLNMHEALGLVPRTQQ